MERGGDAEVRGSELIRKFYSTKISIMKRILFLFMLLLSLNAVAQTGTNIFSYGTNREVISSKVFTSYRMFWKNNWALVADTTFTIESEDKPCSYKIVLEKVMNDPSSKGHFNSIQISNASNHKPLLVLKNADDWCHTNIWSYGMIDTKYILV